jgi:hypothetical protein
MKTLWSVRSVVLSIAIVTLLSTTSLAQNRERFGISAKAGGVNAVVGHVMVSRKGQQPQLLTNRDDLVVGDVVTTGALSNIEVLLNPGSYFRLGENSEAQLVDTALDNLRLKLNKGTAIVEVTGVENIKFEIPIETPQATFTILRAGLYRLSVETDSVELAVKAGRASFSDEPKALVKGGKKVTISGGMPTVAKIDKSKDNIDLWSKQRAELLARANAKLSNSVLNGYLGGFENAGFASSRWGLWMFSSRMGCYTFLPFYWGWSSPYGHYYGSYYWRGGGWGAPSNFPGTTGGTVVTNNQPSGPNGGGSPSGVPAPTYVPPPMQSPMRVDPDSGISLRNANRTKEPGTP